MVEGIKVVGGLILSLCPYNGDFIGFECLKVRFDPTRLEKSSLVGL
ncbi:hypothetical protein JT115_05130 [Helicobacter pylori]|nr:hypothetical protein [Helicobacter pylori]